MMIPKASATLFLLALFCLSPKTSRPASQADQPPAIRYLTASFIGDDLSIALVRAYPKPPPGTPVPQGMYLGDSTKLVILKPGPVRELSAIHQLRGLVTIDSPEKALEFVRLRTAPGAWGMVDHDSLPVEAEVVPERVQRNLPDFGINMMPMHIPPIVDGDRPLWGTLGYLSNDGFARGGFEEPQIVTLPDNEGFEITRWTFTQHLDITISDYKGPYMTVQKIRETVGRDGSYRRLELLIKKAPKLPDTKWDFPQFG